MKPCKPGTHRNPKTNRCISNTPPKTHKKKKVNPVVAYTEQLKPSKSKQMDSYKAYNNNIELYSFIDTMFDMSNLNEQQKKTDTYKVLSKDYLMEGWIKLSGSTLCKYWTNSIVNSTAFSEFERNFGVYNKQYVVNHADDNGLVINPHSITNDTIYVSRGELKKLEKFNAQLKLLKTGVPTLTTKHDKDFAKLFSVCLDLMLRVETVDGFTAAECDKYSKILHCLTAEYLFKKIRDNTLEPYEQKAAIKELMDILKGITFRSACKSEFEVGTNNMPIIYYFIAHL